MKRILYFILMGLIAGTLMLSLNSFAKETSLDLNATLNQMIKAVENNDYVSFVEDADDEFKAMLTQQMFDSVSGSMGARFKKGYTLSYLGDLNQQGCVVYLWKFVFNDQGDDYLLRLVIKNAKVSGFWFQ